MPKIADIWRLAALPDDPDAAPATARWRAALVRSLTELQRVLRLLHLRVEQATALPSEVRRYTTDDFSVVSENSVLAAVPGLSFDVAPGAYLFSARLTYDCGAGFTQYTVGGTCTASSALWHSRNWSDATTGYVEGARHTALADPVIEATSVAGVIGMWGLVVVSTAGTLDVRWAQRANDVAASTVLALSWFEVYEAANPLQPT